MSEDSQMEAVGDTLEERREWRSNKKSRIDKHKVIWKLEPHTKAKHDLLRSYLHAWLPIMQRNNRRLIVLDGFSGPGVYKDGEPGSPIVALEALVDHASFGSWRETNFLMLFCEQDDRRNESLRDEIATWAASRPALHNVEIGIEDEAFADVGQQVIDNLGKRGLRMAPTLALLDPFGAKGLPMSVIADLMRLGQSEVAINLAAKNMARFAETNEMESHLEALYGDDRWREVLDLKVADRGDRLLELYLDALADKCQFRHLWSFEMLSRGTTSYHLVYGTKHELGLIKMKDAMWKVDESGQFRFEAKVGGSSAMGLWDPAATVDQLQDDLARHFAGQRVSPQQVTSYVINSTPYRQGHVKKMTLTPMEKSGRIHVDRPGRIGFPDGKTLITFPPA